LKIHGQHHQSLTFDSDKGVVTILDQTLLPFEVKWIALTTLEEACYAIAHMQVRGAPAIGAVAAYGMVLAIRQNLPLNESAQQLKATRPTAVNLAWAVDRMLARINVIIPEDAYAIACEEAANIAAEDVAACSAIGDAGLAIIEKILAQKTVKTINVLTHCNAGWLATVDWGTALAPVYKAQQKGINIHVWVDETRPRNQGAFLTCFELQEQGIAHTLIADNTGGYLMQSGQVDLCIVGSDRTTANGDVCNKIGTYLKALAAADNNVPFYVALPSSTIDWNMKSGNEIPIEYRSEQEVLTMVGCNQSGQVESIAITAPGTKALNPAFDVTPAKYVTGLITELGVFEASTEGLQKLKGKLENAR
jgi:methylthioribose-1-phosphate isomerase